MRDVVSLVVFREFRGVRRVLLLQRAKDETWCTPSGKVEPGETEMEAAARELMEETGLVLAGIGPVIRTHYHQSRHGDGELRILTHIVWVLGGEPPEINDESIGFGWFSLDEVHGMSMVSDEQYAAIVAAFVHTRGT